MKNAITNRRRRERGMTLAEALIAVLVFSVVFLAALMLYNTANRAYIATDSATIQQQNARFAMDRMMNTLRSAGASYNVVGASNIPDEQIEFADQSAVFVRGDFDNQRETALQNTAHPYVTVGNNEIVGYILRKPGDDTVNTVGLNMRLDTTTTGGRDATLSGSTPAGEESLSVRAGVKDLTQTWNPPYQLVRVTFSDAGSPVYEVVADNVFRMSFVYTKADGTPMTTYGGADTDRAERALIRKIDVNLITMTDKPDFRYTDPNTYTPAEGAATKRYRKFPLSEFVVASNLGLKGKRHSAAPPLEIEAPPTLTVCSGHDRAFYLSWGASPTAGVTDYEIHVQGTAPIVNDTVMALSATTYRYQQPLTDQTIQPLTFTVNGKSGAYSGLPSPSVTKTSTHEAGQSVPSAIGNLQFTAPGNNTLALTWDPVRTSTGTLTQASCTTMPGGATSVPPAPWNHEAPDLREYHVYRKILTATNGATGAFNPSDTNPSSGTRVDNYSVGGSMTNTTPITNSLSETTNALTDYTAAPCARYFYRAIAFDSEPLPAVASIGAMGSAAWSTPASYLARAGVTPEKPATPGPTAAGVVTGGGNYTLTVQWQPDLKDSTGAVAYTAHYRLYLERALSGSPSTWTSISTRDYYETYQIAAPDVLPINPSGFGVQTASYRYKVEAIYDCNDIGDTARTISSDWYTVTCTFTPTVAATGTSIGNGSQINPWELDYPDYVQVSPPAGVTISSVTFTMKEDVTGNIITGPTTTTTAPFRFQYFNQQDLTIYRLEVQATSSTGCTYSGVYYIKDAPPTPSCLLGTSTSTGPTSFVPNGSCGNKIITTTVSYTVPNTSSTEDLTLKQIKVDWAMDSAHADATLQSITFPTNKNVSPTINGCTTSGGVCSGSTGLVTVPATAGVVGANTTTYTITLTWDYNKCPGAITSTPVTSICLMYTSPATGTNQRFCNLVGGTSNNPGACN